MAGTWLPADVWIAQRERELERRRLPVRVRPWPALAELAKLERRPPIDQPAAEQAAELARRVGVRTAARELGIPHPTLRSAWQRFGIEVTPPTRAGGARRRPA